MIGIASHTIAGIADQSGATSIMEVFQSGIR
ncbi:Uncharacterised protein [Vibrio cholerae]|nr:Uncharacterised protein [Vibrio cholerae]CSI77588.1 Uncharacterised protein [Vibrio cholerae]